MEQDAFYDQSTEPVSATSLSCCDILCCPMSFIHLYCVSIVTDIRKESYVEDEFCTNGYAAM